MLERSERRLSQPVNGCAAAAFHRFMLCNCEAAMRSACPCSPISRIWKNARPAVRPKNQAEQLRNEVMNFLAVAGVGHDAAVGAGGVAVFEAAGPHLAPRGLLVLVAAGATSAAVRSTCAAIQTAIGRQIGVCDDRLHESHATSSSVRQRQRRGFRPLVPQKRHRLGNLDHRIAAHSALEAAIVLVVDVFQSAESFDELTAPPGRAKCGGRLSPGGRDARASRPK